MEASGKACCLDPIENLSTSEHRKGARMANRLNPTTRRRLDLFLNISMGVALAGLASTGALLVLLLGITA